MIWLWVTISIYIKPICDPLDVTYPGFIPLEFALVLCIQLCAFARPRRKNKGSYLYPGSERLLYCRSRDSALLRILIILVVGCNKMKGRYLQIFPKTETIAGKELVGLAQKACRQ